MLAHGAAYIAAERPRDLDDVFLPAILVAAGVFCLVTWLARRGGASTETALPWGLGAGAMTLVFTAAPLLLFIVTCGDCLQ